MKAKSKTKSPLTRAETVLVFNIVERAFHELKQVAAQCDRLSVLLDIEHAHAQYPLRLEELLKAEAFDFAHDVVGIINHMNRETGLLERGFVPRYTAPTEAR